MRLIREFYAYTVCSFGGLEGAILSAALTGAGMIMQDRAADRAADKQQRIINDQLERESQARKKKADLIEGTAREVYDPAARDAKYESMATQNEKSLVDSLAEANGATGGDVNKSAEGNLSADYVRSRATATSDAAADIRRRAKLTARANAGGLMFQNEANRLGQLNSDLGMVGANAASDRRVSNARLSRVENNGSLAAGLMSSLAPVAGSALNNYLGSSMQLPKGYEKLPEYPG